MSRLRVIPNGSFQWHVYEYTPYAACFFPLINCEPMCRPWSLSRSQRPPARLANREKHPRDRV